MRVSIAHRTHLVDITEETSGGADGVDGITCLILKEDKEEFIRREIE